MTYKINKLEKDPRTLQRHNFSAPTVGKYNFRERYKTTEGFRDT